ncbi:MAG: GntR family transcriptional regulator [Spirochaetales bacterium]
MDTAVRAASDQSNLSESVYEQLVDLIVSGDIADGESVGALGVSKRLGVSRSPAHTAILRLEADGLVSFGSDRQARVISVTRERVFEVYEMRKILEAAAADRAAGHMTLAETQPLRARLRELAPGGQTSPGGADPRLTQWAEIDEAFHTTIAEGSGLPSLARDIARYRLVHRAMNRSFMPPEKLGDAIAEHLAILNAVEARDPAAARERMLAHLEAWQRHFIERAADRSGGQDSKHSKEE